MRFCENRTTGRKLQESKHPTIIMIKKNNGFSTKIIEFTRILLIFFNFQSNYMLIFSIVFMYS